MSLIKKADVKNHLSARHRSAIHLTRPESPSGATRLSHEESSGADPNVMSRVESPLNTSRPSEPSTTPLVTSKSAKP